MKIFISTCNTHLHLVPIFCHLFNKFWSSDQEVTILGYNHPETYKGIKLPLNFKFDQLNGGDQGTSQDFSDHMRRYFSQVDDDHFIWGVEDTFIKSPVDFKVLNAFKEICNSPCGSKVGRIDLTEGMSYRPTSLWKSVDDVNVLINPQDADSRVTMQISIWNKEYLLSYLKPNRNPWQFEEMANREAFNDGWDILGTHRDDRLAVVKNEGVFRKNINHLHLQGMDAETLKEINMIRSFGEQ